jgi:hypothetical protein
MPLLANPPELLLTADNCIIPFYQLTNVNHTYNMCAVTSLQIPQVVFGCVVFILPVLAL